MRNSADWQSACCCHIDLATKRATCAMLISLPKSAGACWASTTTPSWGSCSPLARLRRWRAASSFPRPTAAATRLSALSPRGTPRPCAGSTARTAAQSSKRGACGWAGTARAFTTARTRQWMSVEAGRCYKTSTACGSFAAGSRSRTTATLGGCGMSTRGTSTGLSLPFLPLPLLSVFPSAPSLAPHSPLVSLRLIHTHARAGRRRQVQLIHQHRRFLSDGRCWLASV